MNAAQTEAFNHITSGTRPRALRSTGSSFVLKDVEGQEDRQENSWENRKKQGDPFPIALSSHLEKLQIQHRQQKQLAKDPRCPNVRCRFSNLGLKNLNIHYYLVQIRVLVILINDNDECY